MFPAKSLRAWAGIFGGCILLLGLWSWVPPAPGTLPEPEYHGECVPLEVARSPSEVACDPVPLVRTGPPVRSVLVSSIRSVPLAGATVWSLTEGMDRILGETDSQGLLAFDAEVRDIRVKCRGYLDAVAACTAATTEIRLERESSLEVHVVDLSGVPLPGVNVLAAPFFLPRLMEDRSSHGLSAAVHEVCTNQEGIARIAALPAGEVHLRCHKDGWVPIAGISESALRIPPEEQVEIRVSMGPCLVALATFEGDRLVSRPVWRAPSYLSRHFAGIAASREYEAQYVRLFPGAFASVMPLARIAGQPTEVEVHALFQRCGWQTFRLHLRMWAPDLSPIVIDMSARPADPSLGFLRVDMTTAGRPFDGVPCLEVSNGAGREFLRGSPGATLPIAARLTSGAVVALPRGPYRIRLAPEFAACGIRIPRDSIAVESGRCSNLTLQAPWTCGRFRLTAQIGGNRCASGILTIVAGPGVQGTQVTLGWNGPKLDAYLPLGSHVAKLCVDGCVERELRFEVTPDTEVNCEMVPVDK